MITGGRVEAVSAQGPVIRVVGEDGAVRTELVDERCRVGRPGQLRPDAAPAGGLPGGADQQDGQGGQVRQDLVLADIGVLRPAGSGTVALV